MNDRSINSPQVHYRGIPSCYGDDNSPGSIVELYSTSFRVVLLKSNIVSDSSTESNYDLFKANAHTIEKTQDRFYYVVRKEFRDKIHIDTFQKIKLVVPKASTEVGSKEGNIRLEVWPQIFVCDNCNLVFAPDREDKTKIIAAGVFKECPSCGGTFRQSPHILICKICGSIRHIPSKCVDCGAPLHLMRGSEVDVETWKLECTDGHVHEFSDYTANHQCKNEDGLIPEDRHRDISQGRRVGRSVMTTVGRGISAPLILRFPIGKAHRAMQDEQKLLVASNTHTIDLKKFTEISRAAHEFEEGGEFYENIRDQLSRGANPPTKAAINEAVQSAPADGIRTPPSKREYEAMYELSRFSAAGYDFSEECNRSDLLNRCDDWITLMSGVPTRGLKDLDDLLANQVVSEQDLAPIRRQLKIMQVRYLEMVSLVSGTYGMVRGSIHPIHNREPIDVVKVPLDNIAYGHDRDGRVQLCKNDSRGLPVIATKRETEGLAFIIEARDIVRMLQNKRPDVWKSYSADGIEPSTLSENQARAWLMYACHGKKHGEDVTRFSRTVVHTISHAIIHRFPKSSGLRDADLGELLYPEFCGFVLYNGLEIPLGMLRRVFKDNIKRLLEDEIILEMNDCDMDPTCRQQREGAACHACLHVPDHVCENFNADLDRKVLIDEEGYWR